MFWQKFWRGGARKDAASDLFDAVSKAVHAVESEEQLPPWAVKRATTAMERGAVLDTRDGRRTGNATTLLVRLLWVRDDAVSDVAIVQTDAGNLMLLTESELSDLFYTPRWVKRMPGW